MLNYNEINWEEWVYYDETSPTFLRWKVDRFNGYGGNRLLKSAGDVAGFIGNEGYARTSLFRKQYLNHRIIWIMFNGETSVDLEVDHINGNRADNSIENLRIVSRTINRRNKSIRYNNRTGVNGVGVAEKDYGKCYIAYWYDLDGKSRSKYFSSLRIGEEEAFKLACEYRKNKIEELNLTGAGYTDRHGNYLVSEV